MYVNSVSTRNTVYFKSYRSILKTLWKQGQLPSVKRDLYGSLLTNENCSIDHLIPKSSGGPNSLYNYALATIENNFVRGDKPLNLYKDKIKLGDYLAQFVGIKLPNFDGTKYIDGVLETFRKIFSNAN